MRVSVVVDMQILSFKISHLLYPITIINFVPTLNHSFKNFSDKSQFFIIADVATDDKKLTKEFWDSYLYFSVSNYIR